MVADRLKELLSKHIEMVDKLSLSKDEKRILVIKSALMSALFTGEKLSKIVRDISERFGVSESTVWKVIRFDKAYTQIHNDYMQVLEYLKQEIKEKSKK